MLLTTPFLMHTIQRRFRSLADGFFFVLVEVFLSIRVWFVAELLYVKCLYFLVYFQEKEHFCPCPMPIFWLSRAKEFMVLVWR